MVKKRRVIMCTVLFGLAAFGGLLWLWPVSAINKDAFERIEYGMSLSQVEEILGGPARDESTRDMADVVVVRPNSGLVKTWTSNKAIIAVSFDSKRVSLATFSEPDERRMHEMLLRWVGW